MGTILAYSILKEVKEINKMGNWQKEEEHKRYGDLLEKAQEEEKQNRNYLRQKFLLNITSLQRSIKDMIRSVLEKIFRLLLNAIKRMDYIQMNFLKRQ